MHLALVVVPDPPALPREHGADAQEEGYAAWLEEAALRIPKRPALAFEYETARDLLVAEDQITAMHAADVIECGLANDGVAGDQPDQAPSRSSVRATVPGQGIHPADRRAVSSSRSFGLGIASLAVPGTVPGDAMMNRDLAHVLALK